jgi:hypothetical protein
MISARLEAYLSRLQHELQKHGLVDTTIIDEVREHLLDAVAAGLRRGLSVDAAEHEAFVRFGAPDMVAAGFANERDRMLKRLVIVLSKIGGLLRGTASHRGSAPHPAHYHDVGPSRYHFALRLKRPYRNRFGTMSVDEQKQFIAQMRERGEDVSAFETDPRERLVRFLEDFGRRTFGSTGTLESLTLLEDTTDPTRRGGRYLAAFGGGSKMIWSVALSADGAVSFDGTSAVT